MLALDPLDTQPEEVLALSRLVVVYMLEHFELSPYWTQRGESWKASVIW